MGLITDSINKESDPFIPPTDTCTVSRCGVSKQPIVNDEVGTVPTALQARVPFENNSKPTGRGDTEKIVQLEGREIKSLLGHGWSRIQ